MVKIAAGTQPYGALAWSGVSLLLPLLTSSTVASEAMLKGFNSICDIQYFWKIFEDKFLGPLRRENYRALLEPLTKLYSYIVEYQARAICYLASAQLSRARQIVSGCNDWNDKEGEITRLSEVCRQCVGTLETDQCRVYRDRRLEEMLESRDILDEIRTVLDNSSRQNQMIYQDKNEREFLQNLACDYEDGKNFNPTKLEGTCKWFYTDPQFRKWRDSKSSSLFWLSAGPGCGKSVLSRALIDEQRLSTNITTSTVCYFFFKDGFKERVEATHALCAILHQLFSNDPSGKLIHHAMHSHKSYGISLKQNFSELWRILLDCASDAGEIVCVLDALDECNKASWDQLINRLNEFFRQSKKPASAHSHLKFLITSRPDDNLELSFEAFSHTSAYIPFHADERSSNISDDINLVIDAEVNTIASVLDETDRKRFIDRLKKMVNRTYLWLHLTLRIIKESPGQYSRRSDLEALLSQVPTKVSKAYEDILSRSNCQEQTQLLLHIVLASMRPLSLEEANAALTIASSKKRLSSDSELRSEMWSTDAFKRKIKCLCGPFISVYDSKLSFIHQTAREFLIDSENKGRWQGRFDITLAHKTMSLICLENLSYLDDQSLIVDTISEDPFMQYSTLHWMDHAKPVDGNEEVQTKIAEFFLHRKSAYTTWVELFHRWDDGIWFMDEFPRPMYYASLAGLFHTVEILLHNGGDASSRSKQMEDALLAACNEGHRKIAELLLEWGTDINQGERISTPLTAAICHQREDVIQLLLERDADVNVSDFSKTTPCYYAADSGNTEVVRLLLERNADVDKTNNYGNSPLQAASEGGYTDIVQLLLANHANVHIRTSWESTALYAAAKAGHTDIVRLLLEKGADVNGEGEEQHSSFYCGAPRDRMDEVQPQSESDADVCEQDEDLYTPPHSASHQGSGTVYHLTKVRDPLHLGTSLQAACNNGHMEIVQLLLENGADTNMGRSNFGTALQGASRIGHTEIIQLLLENGADINAEGHFHTALQAASEEGYEEIVQLLLDNGADVNAIGFYGTALRAACTIGHEQIVQLLLQKGADINAAGHFGTALEAASEHGYKGTVQLLLEGCAGVIAVGGTDAALLAACIGGHKEIMMLLLQEGANVNTPLALIEGNFITDHLKNKHFINLLLGEDNEKCNDTHPINPLQIACLIQREDVAEILIDNHADINMTEGCLCSALQFACLTRCTDIVQLLLEKGADVNGKGSYPLSPLEIAYEDHSEEIIQLLLKNGACSGVIPSPATNASRDHDHVDQDKTTK